MRSLCEIRGDCFEQRYFSEGTQPPPQKKYWGTKTATFDFTQWLLWCKAIIVIDNRYFWHFCMYFKNIFSIEMLLNIILVHLLWRTHPCVNILISSKTCSLRGVTNTLLHVRNALTHVSSHVQGKNMLTFTPETLRVIKWEFVVLYHNDMQHLACKLGIILPDFNTLIRRSLMGNIRFSPPPQTIVSILATL